MDKPRFSIEDLLGFMSVPAKATKAVGKGVEKVGGFINDQVIGPEAVKYWNEAVNPSVDFSGAGHQQGYAKMGNISGITDNPYSQRIMHAISNLTNAATHSGLGKWFAADSLQNITGGNPSGKAGNAGDFGNALFSMANLGVGKAGKKIGKAANAKEMMTMINLLKGFINPTD